jgi:hypothetical protein
MACRKTRWPLGGNIDQGRFVYYWASKSHCSACSLKPKCTTAPVRKITRDIHEDMRDRNQGTSSATLLFELLQHDFGLFGV